MDEAPNLLPVTLDLGEVQLTPDELLGLREGATIRLDRPAVLKGALNLGKTTWAYIDIAVEGDHLNVTIRELTQFPEKKITNIEPERKLSEINSDCIDR